MLCHEISRIYVDMSVSMLCTVLYSSYFLRFPRKKLINIIWLKFCMNVLSIEVFVKKIWISVLIWPRVVLCGIHVHVRNLDFVASCEILHGVSWVASFGGNLCAHFF